MGKPIQVRDVPDDVREALAAKAHGEGLSLSAYIRRILLREARRPALSEVLARTGGRARGSSMDDIVAMIRQDRSRSS